MRPRSLTDEGRAVPGALLMWRSAFKQNANLMLTLSLPVLRKIGAGEIRSGISFGLMVIKYLVMEFDAAGRATRQNQISPVESSPSKVRLEGARLVDRAKVAM